jgi:molybdenum cofactor cytidylyltransferase
VADQQCLAGLLLAAGGSVRFGAPKPLAMWRGVSLARRAVDLLAAACPAGVLVVSGAADTALRQDLGPDVRVVTNPQWASGLGSSLGCGVRHLPPGVSAVLVMPCDLPAVTSADLARLIAAWVAAPDHVVAASWDQHLGPPAIFPQSRWSALQALQGDRGARDLLATGPRTLPVPMPHAGLDVDTPEDLARLEAGLS